MDYTEKIHCTLLYSTQLLVLIYLNTNALGIRPSRSRPRVSNDNPYVESIFRTCKYRPDYPSKGFSDLTEASMGAIRRQVYEQAKSLHPERWSRETRNWILEVEVWLNPERVSITITENKRLS